MPSETLYQSNGGITKGNAVDWPIDPDGLYLDRDVGDDIVVLDLDGEGSSDCSLL